MNSGFFCERHHELMSFFCERHHELINFFVGAIMIRADSFQISLLFNTQKSFKISLRQKCFLKRTNLDENICNFSMFPTAVFGVK